MRNPNYPFEAVIGALSPFGDVNPNFSAPPPFISDAPYTFAPPGYDSLKTPGRENQAIRDLRSPQQTYSQFQKGIAPDAGGNPTVTSSTGDSKLREFVLVLALTAPVWGTFLILRK